MVRQSEFNKLPLGAVELLGATLGANAKEAAQKIIKKAATSSSPRAGLKLMHYIRELENLGFIGRKYFIPVGGDKPPEHVFGIGDGTSSLGAATLYWPEITKKRFDTLVEKRPVRKSLSYGWPKELAKYIGEAWVIQESEKFINLKELAYLNTGKQNSIEINTIHLSDTQMSPTDFLPADFNITNKYIILVQNPEKAEKETLENLVQFVNEIVYDKEVDNFGIYGEYRAISNKNPIRTVLMEWSKGSQVIENVLKAEQGSCPAHSKLGESIRYAFSLD